MSSEKESTLIDYKTPEEMGRRGGNNSIFVIYPYWHLGSLVFDDPKVGLSREALVAGVPEMLEETLKEQNIEVGSDGFSLTFSAIPFPGHHKKVDRGREEAGGTWYKDSTNGKEGWLCPALFLYFPGGAPESLHISVASVRK